MKKILYIVNLFLVIVFFSCKEPEPVAGFEDAEQYSIYDFIVVNSDNPDNPADYNFSEFLKIIQVGGIDKTLSAYNPNGTDYTLFLPDNNAIEKFIQTTEGFSSINDILNNITINKTLPITSSVMVCELTYFLGSEIRKPKLIAQSKIA